MRRYKNMRGFSLVEMLIVIGVILIVTAVSVMSIEPALQSTHVSNAYNTTMAAMRQARDFAVAQRQEYKIAFSNAATPNTITITQTGNGNIVATYQLPNDVAFTLLSGMPNTATTTPDGFGVGAYAIDFDQSYSGGSAALQSVIYFEPDGTGQDQFGNINNGVIYIAMQNRLYYSHAITLWGATGRIRGWHLFNKSTGAFWRQD